MSQQAPYSYVTLATARQQLANRLYDAFMVFWSSAELTVYIQEALSTWNALTSYWRGDFTFQSQQGVNWYDLTQLPGTLRPYTTTDGLVYQTILYHLLEPPTGPVSLQYSTDDLVNAVARRRDELLSASSCTQTRRLVGAVNGRITLPDTVIDVRRMAYLPINTVLDGSGYGIGRYGFGPYGISTVPRGNFPQPSVLWPEDVWAEQSYNRLFTITPAGTPMTPLAYIMSTDPPLSFDTDAPPPFGGSYELLTVESGGALAFNVPPVPGTLLPVPTDWTHLIKWGALADLFDRESNAKDELRATYCNQRYQMGLQLLSSTAALLEMRIGNVVLPIDSVRGADLFNTSWETTFQGSPNSCLHSGLNLVALAPAPNVGPDGVNPYMLTATVVENAPLPVLDADLVQVGRDILDVLLDYAVHVAALKQGGEEFTATLPLFKRFMEMATVYNRKLKEIAEYTDVIYALSREEKDKNPVMAPPIETNG